MEGMEQNRKQCNELELLYQDAIDNIRFYKQQQWTITNYGFLLYVAIAALHEKFLLAGQPKPTDLEKGILAAVSLLVLIVGGVFIFRFHGGMVGCRRRMEKIRESFDGPSQTAWGVYIKPDHTSYLHNIGISIALTGVLFLGALAVWWAIYR